MVFRNTIKEFRKLHKQLITIALRGGVLALQRLISVTRIIINTLCKHRPTNVIDISPVVSQCLPGRVHWHHAGDSPYMIHYSPSSAENRRAHYLLCFTPPLLATRPAYVRNSGAPEPSRDPAAVACNSAWRRCDRHARMNRRVSERVSGGRQL